MKKIAKMSLVAALLFSGISTYAIDGAEDFNLHVIKSNGKLISFGLNQTQKAYLSIYDKDGSLIYSETASGKEGILRTFSLEEFPEGIYFLEIEDNTKKAKYEIAVTDTVTVLSQKAVSSVYKSDFKNTSVAVR
ncbi:secretion protein [Flavobacterium crocinum]|uniref:Secretion protein n=2 Tax=Flavobacterium TaxID=237 RepID=A0A2S1YM20_9FLAO|nr:MULTISPECIES: T9SS type A sorting domain-containing protein [Flavobacterium]AWK05062.1 secretion protein [Flavobacterium crocinum]MBW1656452.1 T9SS type A sorting domain-containing protein [Flavobacterium quisquiliarum]NWL03880.1 T9SS C-terminal target domain-containing protein [Flavobacterium collinsii]